ncbi:hypothetical protein V7S79_07710 [Aquirufa sp. ROCK-SH2]
MTIIFVKMAVAVLLSIFSFIILTQKVLIESLASKNRTFFFVSSFTLLRILPFYLVYIFFNFSPTSDVPIFFDSAKGALNGGFVYRDFQTVYSPLFPYLISIILPFWYHSKAIVLVLILFELVAVYLTYILSNDEYKYVKILFYLSLPTGLVFSVLGGQEDILMWGFISVVLLVFQGRKRHFLSGVLLGFGCLFTKFLFILIIPAFLLYLKKWKTFLIGMSMVGLISFYVLYHNSGFAFLGPLNEANIPRTPNLWSFLHTITNGISPFGQKYLNWIGLIFIELLVITISLRYKKIHSLPLFIQGVFIQLFVFLMIIQQSSYANYAYVFILPLIFYIEFDSFLERSFFLGLNILLVIQPAIWWRNGLPYINSYVDLMNPIKLILFLMEIYILLGLFWIMLKVDKKSKLLLINNLS